MEEIRKPLNADSDNVITSDGVNQIEISPTGSNINYLDELNNWNKCDTTSYKILTGESGRSRIVYDKLPYTVGIRVDSTSIDLVTMRLSSNQTKDTEISFSLSEIEDELSDGTIIKNEFNIQYGNEFYNNDNCIINKGDQLSHIVDNNTLRLLTPKRDNLKSRIVKYDCTVPNGYEIKNGESWLELWGPEGYIKTIRTALLDNEMNHVCDTDGIQLDAISLTVMNNGVNECGCKIYTLIKTSKIDLSSVKWEWFDVEISMDAGISRVESWLEYPGNTWENVFSAASASNSATRQVANAIGAKNACFAWGALWASRDFISFATPSIGTPIQAMLLGKALTTAPAGTSLTINKGTFTPGSVTASSWSQFDNTSDVTCCPPVDGSIFSISLPLVWLNNQAGTKTTLVGRAAWDKTPANGSYVADAAVETGMSALKLILVYAHSGPSKPLFFKDALINPNHFLEDFSSWSIGSTPTSLLCDAADQGTAVVAADGGAKKLVVTSLSGTFMDVQNRPAMGKWASDAVFKTTFSFSDASNTRAKFTLYDPVTTRSVWAELVDDSTVQLWKSNATGSVLLQSISTSAHRTTGKLTLELSVTGASTCRFVLKNASGGVIFDATHTVTDAFGATDRAWRGLFQNHYSCVTSIYSWELTTTNGTRIQFPLRVNRGTTEGAAVLDGLLLGACLNYATDFDSAGFDARIKTGIAYSEVTVNGHKAYRFNIDGQSGWPMAMRPPVAATISGGISLTFNVKRPEGYTASTFWCRLFRQSDGKRIIVWQNGDDNYWWWQDDLGSGGAVSLSSATLEWVKIQITNRTLTITCNVGTIVSNYALPSTWLDADILYGDCGPANGTVIDIYGISGVGSYTHASDLHFRKADGTLIPAFSRTVTKDANNAITQLDYRLSVDVADLPDLPDLTLCYGDLNYSDFAVDASQITGTAIPEAESNPTPGTFWNWYSFDSITSGNGFFWGFG